MGVDIIKGVIGCEFHTVYSVGVRLCVTGGGGRWGRAGLKSSKDGGLAGFGLFKRLHVVEQS